MLLAQPNCKSSITSTTGSSVVCAGTNFEIWYGDTSGVKKLYQWFTGSHPSLTEMVGETSPKITIISTNTYTVRVIDTVPLVDDTGYCTRTITVNPKPDASFTFTPNNTCGKTLVNFTSTPQTINTALNYAWNFGNPSGTGNTSNLTNPSHLYIPPSTGVSTPYTATLTITVNSTGCTDTKNVIVTIGTGPDATLTANASGIQSIRDASNNIIGFRVCSNMATTNFTFSSNTTTAAANISNHSINWGDGSANYNNASGVVSVPHLYDIGLDTLRYTITGTNGCSNTYKYAIFLGTNPAGGINSPGNTTICTGSTLAFPITGTGNNAPGTIYKVTFNDWTPTLTFSHPPPDTVRHTFDTTSCGVSEPGFPANSFYAKLVISNPCDSTPSITSNIRVANKPKVKFVASPNDTICINTTIQFTNTSNITVVPYNGGVCNSANVVWKITPATGWVLTNGQMGDEAGMTNALDWNSGTGNLGIRFTAVGNYTVVFKLGGSNCAYDSAIRYICVNALPTASFVVNKNAFCVGDSLNATSTFNTPLCQRNKFSWTATYTPIANCVPSVSSYSFVNNTFDTSANPTIKFTNPGVYTLRQNMTIGNTGCSITPNTTTITVRGKPNPIINPIPSLCQNANVNVTASDNCNNSSTTYVWTFPFGTPATASTLNVNNVQINNVGNTTLSLQATNECGVTNASTIVNVLTAPTLTTTSSPITICSGQQTGINLSSGSAGTRYTWTATLFSGTASGFSNQALPTTSTTINQTLSNTSTADATVRYTITAIGVSPTNCVGQVKVVDVIVKPGVSGSNAGVNQKLCNQTTVNLAANNPVVGTGTWTKTSGPAGEIITNPNANNTTVTGLVAGDYVFTWTISASLGSCPNSTSSVSINNRPAITTANAGTDKVLCDFSSSNKTIGLTGNAALPARSFETGTWTILSQPVGGGGSFSSANSPTSNLNINAAGTYTLQWTIANDATSCPSTVDTVLVKVYNPPSGGNTNANTTVCKGNNNGTINLTGNIGTVIKWQYAIGSSAVWNDTAVTNVSIDYLNLDTTKRYRAVIASPGAADGCTSTALSTVTTITVNMPSLAGNLAGNATVCSGGNNGVINLTGTNGNIVKWEQSINNGSSWQIVSGAITSTYNYLNLTTTTLYRVIVKNGVCKEDTSNIVTITVNAGVGSANAGADSVLCNATSTILNGNVLPMGFTGVWTQIGLPAATITNPTSNNATVTNLVAGNSYTFRWTVSGLPPCPSSQDDVVIRVRPQVTNANAGADIINCNFPTTNAISLVGNNSGRTYENYQWQILSPATGGSLSNATQSTSTLNLTAIGTYTITYKITNDATTIDEACKQSIDTIVVTVKPITVAGTISGTNTICKNTNVGNLTVTGFTTGAVLQWQQSNNNVSYSNLVGETNSSYNAGVLTSTTWYRVKIYQANCNDTVYTPAFRIQVDEPSAGGTVTPNLTEVCTNSGNVLLNLNAQSGTNIHWIYNINNAGYINFSPAITSTAATILNNPFIINTSTTVKNVVIRAVVKNGVCPADSSAIATINVYPNTEIANAGADIALCNQTSTTLNASTPTTATGIWSQLSGPSTLTIANVNNPTTGISNIALGSYKLLWSLSGSVGNICAPSKDTLDIFNYDTLRNSITISNDTVCTNATVSVNSLQAVTGGNGIYTYQWQQSVDGINWNNITVAGNSATYSFTAANSLLLRRIITSSTCSKISNVVQIIVQAGLTDNLISANQNVCLNATPNLLTGLVPMGGNGTYNYQWQIRINGVWTNIATATNQNYQPPIFTTVADTLYRRLTSSGFCNNHISNNITLSIKPHAQAAYTFTTNKLCAPATISASIITAQAFNDRNSIYQWYANDVLIGTGITFPGYNIVNTGDTVYIKLKAISLWGCNNDSVTYKFYTVKRPTVSFTKNVNRGCGPLTVSFTNTTTPFTEPNYLWDFGNGITSNLASPNPVTYNADISTRRRDTTYYISLKAFNQCDTVWFRDSVLVRPKPLALFQPDTTIGCSPFLFRAFNNSLGSPNTYNWDFGNGNTLTNNTNGYVTNTFNTGIKDTFTVKLTAQNECGIDSFKVDVVVFPNTVRPNLIIDGNAATGCAPQTVRMVNNSTNANRFVLNFGDATPNYISTKAPDTIYHTYNTAGTYTVSLLASNGCSDSTTNQTLTFYSKPTASFTVPKTTYCVKELISFTNTSATGLAYEWYFADGNTSTTFNTTHSFANTGTYVVKLAVKNIVVTGITCTDTARVTITVISNPTATITSNALAQNCAPFTFNGTTTQPNTNVVNWYFSNPFSTDTTRVGNTASHIFTVPGTYTIRQIVINQYGCSDTTKTFVNVIETPEAKFLLSDTLICTPGKLVNAVNQTTYTALDVVDYKWLVNGFVQANSRNFSNNYTASINITTAVVNTIQLISTNSFGCTDTADAKLTIQPKAQPNFTTNVSTGCVPLSISLNNTSTYANIFKWYINNVLVSTDSLPINQTLILPSTNYTIKLVSDHRLGCGVDSMLKPITTFSKPQAAIRVSNRTSCTGILNVQFNDLSSVVGSTITGWIWNFGNGANSSIPNPNYTYTIAGQYTANLVATDARGCKSDTAFVTLKNFGKPTSRFSVNNVCINANIAPINLSSLGYGSTAFTLYQWNWGDGNISTGLSPTHSYSIEGNYTIRLVTTSDSSCVPDTAVFPIKVIGKPKASFSVVSNCINVNTRFIDQSIFGFADNGIGTYNWNFGNGNFSASANPTTTFNTTGVYPVRLIVAGSLCPTLKDTIDKLITVYRGRTSITYPRIETVRNSSTPLQSQSGGVNYLWSPSIGLSNTQIQNPMATYDATAPNIINYNIAITDTVGCTVIDKQEVWIFNQPDVLVPTAFTPNGDGANDVLLPFYVSINRLLYFRVYDRWGKQIFETSQIGKAWDGTQNGKPMPMDTYVWVAEAVSKEGTKIMRKGNITLVRE